MATYMKDSELKAILAEVEAEIGDLLKTEKDRLAKAFPEDEAASPDASAPPAESTPPPPAAEGSAESPEASSAAPGEAPGEQAPAGEEAGEIHPANDLASLQAEYEQLPPEELKMHMLACKGAVEKLLGAAGGAPPPDDGMGAGAGAPPPPAASPSAPPALKSESHLEAVQPKGQLDGGESHLEATQPKGQISNGESHLEAVQPKGALKAEMSSSGSGGEMLATKSEPAFTDLKKKVQEQDDTLNKLVGAVARFIGRPERKAVTSVTAMSKTEEKKIPGTRAEIQEKLKELTGPDGKLSKKERELINAYCVGQLDLSKIEHLLAK